MSGLLISEQPFQAFGSAIIDPRHRFPADLFPVQTTDSVVFEGRKELSCPLVVGKEPIVPPVQCQSHQVYILERNGMVLFGKLLLYETMMPHADV